MELFFFCNFANCLIGSANYTCLVTVVGLFSVIITVSVRPIGDRMQSDEWERWVGVCVSGGGRVLTNQPTMYNAERVDKHWRHHQRAICTAKFNLYIEYHCLFNCGARSLQNGSAPRTQLAETILIFAFTMHTEPHYHK